MLTCVAEHYNFANNHSVSLYLFLHVHLSKSCGYMSLYEITHAV